MKVCIYQPCFFTWTGYFQRASLADTFVHFDHVQAPRGKSWVTRNRILVDGKVEWLTIPIYRKGRSLQRVADIRINYGEPFERKHLRTLQRAYGKCDSFEETYAFVEKLYSRKHEYLAEFSKEFISGVCRRVGISAEFVSSAKIAETHPNLYDLRENELVLALSEIVGATEYISGEGCLDFIDPSSFEINGVGFYFHNTGYPPYQQVGSSTFIPALSTLDMLFNIGFDGMKGLIGQGQKLARPSGAKQPAGDQ